MIPSTSILRSILSWPLLFCNFTLFTAYASFCSDKHLIMNQVVVAEWFNVSFFHFQMLKVEQSILGASILKFGLFPMFKEVAFGQK